MTVQWFGLTLRVVPFSFWDRVFMLSPFFGPKYSHPPPPWRQIFATPFELCKSIVIWPWLRFVWRKKVAYSLRNESYSILSASGLTPWAGQWAWRGLGNCTSRKKNITHTGSEIGINLLKIYLYWVWNK